MGLYIIGTSHADKIDGPNGLNEVYARINPEVLLSELSEDDGRRLDEIREGLRVALRRYTDDEVAISRLDRAISPGFEYDCNRAYAKAKGVEHHMIGSDSATTIKLARLGIQNLLASLEEGSDTIDFNALASDVEQDCRDVGEDVRGSIAKCIGREKNCLVN